jgi:hypothetical protein
MLLVLALLMQGGNRDTIIVDSNVLNSVNMQVVPTEKACVGDMDVAYGRPGSCYVNLFY